MSLTDLMASVARPVVHDDLARYMPELAARPGGAPFVWYTLSDAQTQACYEAARAELRAKGEEVTNGNAVAIADALDSRVAWHLLFYAMRDPDVPGTSAADPFPRTLARSMDELAAFVRPQARVELLQRYVDIGRDVSPGQVRRLSSDELRSVRVAAKTETGVRLLEPALLRSFVFTVATGEGSTP